MTTSDELWAKSQPNDQPPERSASLAGHLLDVHTAALKVLDATGDDQLRALGLEPERYRDRLRRCVLLAAAVHDFGKANDHFQGMILRRPERRDKPQGLRHEWVTIRMLDELRAWLLPAVAGCKTDLAIVEWAVAGHHPGHNHASPPQDCPPGAGTKIVIDAGHPRMSEILSWVKKEFRLADPPPGFTDSEISLVGGNKVFPKLIRWAKAGLRLRQEMGCEDQRFVAAVKNCLIAADVAGSALPREVADEAKRWQWITDSFAAVPGEGELQAVVEARARSFEGSNPEQDRFQKDVAASEAPVSFVKAGCGTGKTFAAYMWAARNHPRRRLFFCYPTTGTATEGFRDYLFEPGVRADLFHSRRDVDFEIILTTGADVRDADRDAAIRVESLDAWATPIVACTVDTVLGLVQNNKRGLFSWPALAQSAFVFDEIHAYDHLLFGALLRFLRDLPGLPALLMTASLPKAREEALRQTLLDRGVNKVELTPILGPASLEALPRYHDATVEGRDPLKLVKETFDAGGKVLWVCNTVGRVMDEARRAETIGLRPLIYHSRFRYEDRVNRHKDVIEAFRPENGPALAICSQVAEMSLDLSADLLVTDLAPVPALIQRLGRLNRRARREGDPTKPFVVVEPETYFPYLDREKQPEPPGWPEVSRSWLTRLGRVGITQRELVETWEQDFEEIPPPGGSCWLDGGPTTQVGELRKASPGITVILNTRDYPDHDSLLRHEERIREVRKQARAEGRKPDPDELKPREDERRLAAVTFPMPPPPRSLEWRRWEKHKGILVVPDDEVSYSPIRGAEWRK